MIDSMAISNAITGDMLNELLPEETTMLLDLMAKEGEQARIYRVRPDDFAIECIGPWTGGHIIRLLGTTIGAAIRAAFNAKAICEQPASQMPIGLAVTERELSLRDAFGLPNPEPDACFRLRLEGNLDQMNDLDQFALTRGVSGEALDEIGRHVGLERLGKPTKTDKEVPPAPTSTKPFPFFEGPLEPQGAPEGVYSPNAGDSSDPAHQPDVLLQPTCKGSWSLGTACGRCPRCWATALDAAVNLQAQLRVTNEQHARERAALRADRDQWKGRAFAMFWRLPGPTTIAELKEDGAKAVRLVEPGTDLLLGSKAIVIAVLEEINRAEITMPEYCYGNWSRGNLAALIRDLEWWKPFREDVEE